MSPLSAREFLQSAQCHKTHSSLQGENLGWESGSVNTLLTLKFGVLALIELGTPSEYFEGNQPHELALSPSIQLPCAFQHTQQT